MTAAGNYLTQADVEGRITASVVVQIFGDSAAGALTAGETDNLQDFILDAESEVEQVLAKLYGKDGLTTVRALGVSAPRSIKRMMLDCFEVRAYRRHPEYIRADWIERERAVKRDLEALRVRELELDSAAEPDAQNEGGAVESGDPCATDPTPAPKVFIDGTGFF